MEFRREITINNNNKTSFKTLEIYKICLQSLELVKRPFQQAAMLQNNNLKLTITIIFFLCKANQETVIIPATMGSHLLSSLIIRLVY